MYNPDNVYTDLYSSTNHPTDCGSDIIKEYMKSRVIHSKFLMDERALSNMVSGTKLPTTNTDSDDKNNSCYANSLKKDSQIECYLAPPPIKRTQ